MNVKARRTSIFRLERGLYWKISINNSPSRATFTLSKDMIITKQDFVSWTPLSPGLD